MLLQKLKSYAYSILGSVIALLSIILLNERRKAAKKKAEEYKAIAHRATIIAERDNEIEGQTESRRAEAAREVEKGKHPGIFTDPNRMFSDKDN